MSVTSFAKISRLLENMNIYIYIYVIMCVKFLFVFYKLFRMSLCKIPEKAGMFLDTGTYWSIGNCMKSEPTAF